MFAIAISDQRGSLRRSPVRKSNSASNIISEAASCLARAPSARSSSLEVDQMRRRNEPARNALVPAGLHGNPAVALRLGRSMIWVPSSSELDEHAE